MGFFTKPGLKTILLTAIAGLMTQTPMFAQRSNNNAILSIERNAIDNTPKSISFAPDAKLSSGNATDILQQYLNLPAGYGLLLRYSTTSKQGMEADRYNEYYKNIKVERGNYTVSSKGGIVSFITGNVYNVDNSLSTEPAISEATAFAKALDKIGAEKYAWQNPNMEQFLKTKTHNPDTSYLPKGNIVWIEDMSDGTGDRKLHLAYSFEIYAQKPLSRDIVYVDAVTGKILFRNSLIKHTVATGVSLYSGTVPTQTAHVGGQYILVDSTRGNSVQTVNLNGSTDYSTWVNFTNATTTWPSGVEEDAHWATEKVYDYWSTQQGRLSYDDANGELDNFVHYDVNYDNAFWDGYEMTYGDGSGVTNGGFAPLAALDVTAHEIGHGVCQYTANLDYQGESGGMNEGFSDCWGATIENWANPHETDGQPKETWELGEEIGATPLRSMDNPTLYGQPDTYGGPNWYDPTGCTPDPNTNDNCGVHNNSGVLNHWYYLLCIGGSGTNGIGNAFNVLGIGMAEGANILYQTELVLANNAQFADCRTASINIATNLYGTCSPEVEAVTRAWYAVGVGSNFTACTARIGFGSAATTITENAATTACPASRTVNIPVNVFDLTPSGGNAVVTASVTGGTAVSGTDYTLTTSSATFASGSNASHNMVLTIFDNGAVNDTKTIKLSLSLTTNGSNTSLYTPLDTTLITINNDDNTPILGGGTQVVTVNTTTNTSNLTSPFFSSAKRAHSQFVITAAELTAAGVLPNVPINAVSFNVVTKNSTIPFTGFTISMGNTATVDMSSGFVTGLTQVYTGNYATTVGVNTIPLSTNFTWNGTSNIAMEFCFGNATTGTANDQLDGNTSSYYYPSAWASSNTGTGGCTLTYNGSNVSTTKPVVRFTHVFSPTPIETTAASTRTWNVKAGQEVYFYSSADSQLIAGLKTISLNLGCVTANVSAAGTGFTPASFNPVNRSVKEFAITPTTNGAAATYNATIYFTNTELNGATTANLRILKTDQPTDATITAANSQVVIPTLTTGTNYIGFSGSFSGFSRFFLIDGPLVVTVTATITPAGPTTFCQGGSVVLNANTGTGYTYQWQNASGNIAGATNSSYTATTSGNYKVTVTNGSANATSAVTVVTVNPLPTATATAAGATTFCQGGSVVINANTGTGLTYQWQNAAGNIAGQTNSSYTATTTGVYKVVVTNGNTCTATSSTVSVTVNSLPTATATAAGPTAFCQGGSVVLNANTGTGLTYQWQNAAGNLAGQTNSNYTATTAGVYKVVVTNASTCSATSSTVTVTVSTLPTATATAAGTTTFCQGGNVIINANTGAGLTYQWQNAAGNIAGQTNSSYTATATGVYKVVVTNGGSCSATSATVSVTVNPGPTATATAAGATSFCQGGSVVINANTGTGLTYQWQNVAGNISGETNNSYTANTAGVYKVVVSNGTGCSATSSTVTVTVSTLPTATATAAGTTTFCQGGNVVLNANTGTGLTYQWQNVAGNITGATNSSYTAIATGVYKVIVTNGGSCSATSATVTVTVNPAPTATATAAGSTTFCVGNNVVINANTGTGLTYQWQNAVGNIAGETNSSYTATTTGVYKVIVTNGNGCTATSATVTVTANPTVTATVTPTGPTTFCQGGSVVLSANTGTGLTYQWQNAAGNITGATNNTFTANTSDGYKVIVTNSTGCTATSSVVTVTVNPIPAATATPAGATTLCQGSSVVINANTGTGYTYQWQNASGDISGQTNNSYTANATGNYKVIVTSIGCTATSTVVPVTVNAVPLAAVLASGNTTFCNGNNVALNANTGTGLTYQWQNASGNISGATNNTYAATATGSYSVVVTNGSCSATSSAIAVTVNAVPAAVITTTGGTAICQGGTITLSSATGPGLSFQWQLAGADISGATNNTYTTNIAGGYVIVVTNVNGCAAASSITNVTINAIPTATVAAAGATSFCQGDNVVLNASTGTGLTYQWQLGGINITGATNAAFTAANSGAYTVIENNTGNCRDTSSAITITVDPLPVPVVTHSGASLSTTSFSTYQWSLNGTPITGATDSSYTATSSGSYVVTVTDANGCAGSSAVTTVSNVGVSSVSTRTDIKIYPNPAQTNVHIESPIKVSASIYTLEGKLVIHQDNTTDVDLTNIANGTYMITLYDENGTKIKTERLVKLSN